MLGAGSVLGPVLEPGEGAWSGSLRPLVTETPWASASELQRSKLREDSPPRWRDCTPYWSRPARRGRPGRAFVG